MDRGLGGVKLHMIVYFVRHSDRLKSDQRDWESPITPKGMSQSESVASRLAKLKIDVVYSSTYKRALQTAEIVAKVLGKQIEHWDDLIESNSETESFELVNERTEKIVNHLVSHHKDQSVLCVSHASMIEKIIAKMVFGDHLSQEIIEDIRLHFGTDNTGISVCEYSEKEGWILRSYNDSSHL